jgi:hypothetical protein
MTIKWRDQWDDDADQIERERTAIDFTGDPGMTRQEPAEDSDINVLMKRMGVTDGAVLPYWQSPRALYGDFSEFPQDPTELANIMRDADVRFMTLPADIRERFNNPAGLLKFMENPKNIDEAVRMGLLVKRTPENPVSLSTGSDKEPPVPPL